MKAIMKILESVCRVTEILFACRLGYFELFIWVIKQDKIYKGARTNKVNCLASK